MSVCSIFTLIIDHNFSVCLMSAQTLLYSEALLIRNSLIWKPRDKFSQERKNSTLFCTNKPEIRDSGTGQ